MSRAVPTYGPWPTSRTIARTLKMRLYMSDLPCPRGHLGLRLTRTGNCLQCKRADERERARQRLEAWKAAHETPVIRREIDTRYRETHRAERNQMKRLNRQFEHFMADMENADV